MMAPQCDRWAVLCPDGDVREVNHGGMYDGSWYVRDSAIHAAAVRNADSTACCGLPGEHCVIKRAYYLVWPPGAA